MIFSASENFTICPKTGLGGGFVTQTPEVKTLIELYSFSRYSSNAFDLMHYLFGQACIKFAVQITYALQINVQLSLYPVF